MRKTDPDPENLLKSKFSSNDLPDGWTVEHDKIIAYLYTHEPLDLDGYVIPSLSVGYTFDQIAKILRSRCGYFSMEFVSIFAPHELPCTQL
jgi:hypothetical protein